MKIHKLQSRIDAVSYDIRCLEKKIADAREEAQLLHAKLAGMSPSYTKNWKDLEVLTHPKFSSLMSRLVKFAYGDDDETEKDDKIRITSREG